MGQEPSPARGPGAPRQPLSGPLSGPFSAYQTPTHPGKPIHSCRFCSSPPESGSSPSFNPRTLGSHHSHLTPSLPGDLPTTVTACGECTDCTREGAPEAGERPACASTRGRGHLCS